MPYSVALRVAGPESLMIHEDEIIIPKRRRRTRSEEELSNLVEEAIEKKMAQMLPHIYSHCIPIYIFCR